MHSAIIIYRKCLKGGSNGITIPYLYCHGSEVFYASVECVDRGLDPLNTNLVVADASRTQKTICLAVSPSLKSYGIPGRARLFEVISKVREVNAMRKVRSPGGRFLGKAPLRMNCRGIRNWKLVL